MYHELNGMVGWSRQLEIILYYFDDLKAKWIENKEFERIV